MKAAFCFSGELRSIDKTIDRIQKHVLDAFDDYDIFYHTWDDDPDMVKLSLLTDHPQFKKLLIEPRKTFDEKKFASNKRPEVFVQGMLRQLYTLKACNLLKKDYEDANKFTYDVVFRMRPDLLFGNDITLSVDDMKSSVSSTLYTTNHDDHLGYNDRFYFSSSQNMDFLSNRFNYLETYQKLGGLIHYETFFKYCVDMLGIDVYRIRNRFVLLRTDGSMSSDLINLKKQLSVAFRLDK